MECVLLDFSFCLEEILDFSEVELEFIEVEDFEVCGSCFFKFVDERQCMLVQCKDDFLQQV